MKIPVFAGNTFSDFVKSAVLLAHQVLEDGSGSLPVYGAQVDGPVWCLRMACTGGGRLRRNGSYTRQVIEGLRMVLVHIYRLRCGLCGKTVSLPYSFLVPYRRFTGKLVCRAIEMYGGEAEETTYREVCTELSVFAPKAEEGAKTVEAPMPTAVRKTSRDTSKEGFCPARSTVFSWVDFACKRGGNSVQQMEKELILRNVGAKQLPVESQVENRNAYKAGLQTRYKYQQEKPAELSRLTYGLTLAQLLVSSVEETMEKLRAYFLQSAEKCADTLSDVSQVLPIAQTSEHQAV
jgi:hypothetical protein